MKNTATSTGANDEKRISASSTTQPLQENPTYTQEQFNAYFDHLKISQEKEKELFKESIQEIQTNFEKEQKKFQNENKERNEKIKDLEKRIQNSNSQAFAILAIFTTVFTFISLNINIFQSIKSASQAVFFMAIIAFFSSIIVSIPLLILQSINGNEIKEKKLIWWIFGIGIGSLILICLIVKFLDFELLLYYAT